jgi:hypothetical protein
LPEENDSSRRRAARAELEIPAAIEPLDGAAGAAPGSILNLGPDGALLESEAKLVQGARIRLGFRLPSHPIRFAIDAEVRWCKGEKRAGVQFSGVGAYDRSVLDDFCQRNIEERRGPGAATGA